MRKFISRAFSSRRGKKLNWFGPANLRARGVENFSRFADEDSKVRKPGRGITSNKQRMQREMGGVVFETVNMALEKQKLDLPYLKLSKNPFFEFVRCDMSADCSSARIVWTMNIGSMAVHNPTLGSVPEKKSESLNGRVKFIGKCLNNHLRGRVRFIVGNETETRYVPTIVFAYCPPVKTEDPARVLRGIEIGRNFRDRIPKKDRVGRSLWSGFLDKYN